MCARAQIDNETDCFFTGRKAEFKLLHESLEKARSGQTQVVLVTGDAGIGKTRLVQEFTKQLSLSEWRVSVWLGHASDISQKLAFSILFQAFRSAIEGLNSEQRKRIGENYPYLRAFLPGLTEDDVLVYPTVEGLSRIWLFEMLRQFVLDLTKFQTVIMWIDDLPNADDDTLEWLQYFVLHSEHCRLLFVGTCRTPILTDANSLYAAIELSWIRQRRVNQIVLGPLRELVSDELIRSFVGRKANDDLRRFVLERTGGVPLFIIEMLQMVREYIEPLPMGIDVAVLLRDYVPQQITEMIDRRIERMPEIEQRIMRFLAVSENSLPWTVLLSAANADADDLANALTHLVHDGLLYEKTSDYEILYAFHHPMMKRAVSLRMTATVNRQIHKMLAKAWQCDVVHSAYHMRNAGSLVDATESIPVLYKAGLYYLSLRAYKSAAEYFEQAWNATKTHVETVSEEQRLNILLMLAEAYIYLDRKTKAMELVDMLYVDSLPVAFKIKLKRFLSWVASLQSPDESMRHIQEALSYWDGTFENEDIFWMLTVCVDNSTNLGDMDSAYTALETMGRYIDQFPTALNQLRFALHETDVYTIDWSKHPWANVSGSSWLEQAIQIGDPEVIYEVYCILGYYQLNIGDFATSLTYLSECMKWTQRFHLVQHEISVRLMGLNGLLLAGRWTKAESEASAVRTLSLEHKADIGLLCSLDFLAALYALQGKWDESKDCMKQSAKLAESVLSVHPVIQNERKVMAAQAVMMLLNERVKLDEPVTVVWANTHGLPIFLTLIEGVLNVRAGFTNAVMGTAQNLNFAAGMRRPNYMKSVSDLLKGLCESKVGKTKRALNFLQKAIDGFINLGTPFEAAFAEYLWAEQAKDLNPNQVIQAAEQGREKFEALGAIPFAKLAQKRIDSLNSMEVNISASGLSTRELEIARCIMQGMSNKQIAETLQISPRTVSTHLSNMYQKLEVHNRVSLTAKLNKLQNRA